MTVIAYGLGAVLVLAAVISGAGSRAMLFPVVLGATFLAIFGTVLLLWRRASLQRALWEIRQAESVVATGLIEAPRADVSELLGDLRRLGFEMAAATDTAIGGGRPIRTWVLTATGDPATTWVEVGIAQTPMAFFLSRGPDGRFLETSYPAGETIDHANLSARPIPTSLDDAFRAHLATLAEWTSRAGAPLAVRTLDDYLSVERELRDRTGGMRIAAYLERIVEPGLRRWATSAAIATATFLALYFLPAGPA
jgi:hypothetical protein